ncbi:MAG: cytochrome c [Acidobacteria bacterium]|nr:cytochrome c [Acidobacteriota bacterium]
MKSHTRFLFTKLVLLTALSLAAGLTASCQKDSVVSDNAGKNTAAVSSTPSDSASASQTTANAQASPTPVGPVGQSTPSSPFDLQPGEKKEMRGNMPVMVGPAKPALTPAPDPFPPRPEPAVVMENGKIKQQWQAPAEALSLTSPVKDNPEAAKLGKDYYMQKCADCHGQSGKGNGWMSAMTKRDGKPLFPTNLASKVVQANSDGELFWKITNGKSPMPAHRIRFDDQQRWLIVAYLRTLKP